MSELVLAFGERLEVEICPICKGTGNKWDWNRKLGKHTENKNCPCERCKGSKYIIVSHWKESE